MATIENFDGAAGVLTSPYTYWAGAATIAERDGAGKCTANNAWTSKSFLNSDAGWSGNEIKANVVSAGTFTTTNLYLATRATTTTNGYECRIAGNATVITALQYRKNGTFLISKTISVEYATAGGFTAYFSAIDNGANVDLYVEIVGATTDSMSYTDTTSVLTGGDSGAAIYNGGVSVNAITLEDAADYDASFGGGGGTTVTPTAGAFSYSGQAVTVDASTPLSIPVASGAAAYAGNSATILLNTILSTATGNTAFSTAGPSVEVDALILPLSATIEIAGQPVTVAVKGGIFPSNAVMALAGNEPALVQAVTLPIPIATATFTGGTVQTSFDRGIVPNAAVVQINGQTVTVDAVFIIIDTGEYIVVPLIRDIVQPMIKDN